MTSLQLTGAAEAIYSRWKTLWGSTTPYAFDDEAYNPEGVEAFVNLAVRMMPSFQETMGRAGNRRFLRSGHVFAHLHGLSNIGRKPLDLLAQQAGDIFEGFSFSGLHFRAVSTKEQGTDGKWRRVLISAPFFFQEIK